MANRNRTNGLDIPDTALPALVLDQASGAGGTSEPTDRPDTDLVGLLTAVRDLPGARSRTELCMRAVYAARSLVDADAAVWAETADGIPCVRASVGLVDPQSFAESAHDAMTDRMADSLVAPISEGATTARIFVLSRTPGMFTTAHVALLAELARMVGAFAGGKILNAKTARSQLLGGIVWGIGQALHEGTLIDHALGRFMTVDLANYHVPVNADIHALEVLFVPEDDRIVSRLGAKGVGEIGIVGVAAAVANAVYHATGKRIRDLPITLDKLMA